MIPLHRERLPLERALNNSFLCVGYLRQTSARGTVLFLPGRSSSLGEREPTLRQLSRRGWDVASSDWRGQGESSHDPDDPHRVHIDSFDRYLEDLQQLITWLDVHKFPRPWVLIGSSLGAHLALRLLAVERQRFLAAVLTAPMCAAITTPIPRWLARCGVRLLTACGLGPRYVDSSRHRLCMDPLARPDLNPDLWANVCEWRQQHPECLTDALTAQWVNAMYRSLKLAHEPALLASIATPTLALHAACDTIVDVPYAYRVLSALPHVQQVVIPKASHHLWMGNTEIAASLWGEIDRFLHSERPPIEPQRPALSQ